jgi:hypothetical protein
MTSKRTQTDPAAALIAQVQRPAKDELPADAIAALRKLVEYNDTRAATGPGRVTQRAAIDMLRKFGWVGGISAFDGLCRRVLGRRSWGLK